MSNVELQSTG